MSGTHHAAHLTAVVVDDGVDFSDEVVGREAQPVSRRLSARGSRFSPIVSHDAVTVLKRWSQCLRSNMIIFPLYRPDKQEHRYADKEDDN